MLSALLIVLTVGWGAYAVAAVSNAGVSFIDVSLAAPSACLLAIAWAIPRRGAGADGRPRPGRLVAWASFAILGGALVAIYLGSQVPANPLFRARFLMSEPALTRAALGLASRDGAHREGLHVGLFRARFATAMSPEEVRFLTADCGVIDQCGLAYRPRSQPTGARYAHIRGPWYLVYEPF
jgi:hypothetical protein